MPRSRYRIPEVRHPHFMTATANNWLPIFTRPQTVEILLESWRFLRRVRNLALFGYVILENRLHLVASPDLSATTQRFGSWMARRITDYLKENRVRRMLELLALFKRAELFGGAGIDRGLPGMVKERRIGIGSRSFREEVPKLELGNQRTTSTDIALVSTNNTSRKSACQPLRHHRTVRH